MKTKLLLTMNILLLPAVSMAVIVPAEPVFPIPSGQYESSNRTGFATIETEIISMNLTGTPGPATVDLPSPGETFNVDSFFDIAYSFSSGGDFHVDSFFDISTELSITGTENTNGRQEFDTEILSMSLTGGYSDTQLRLGSGRHHGHVTVLKLSDTQYQVDSFFDIWTEISLDDGQNWYGANEPLHFELTNIVPEPATMGLLALGSLMMIRRSHKK